MKQKKQIVEAIIVVICLIILAGNASKYVEKSVIGESDVPSEETDDSAEQYYGKWKVVAYLPLNTTIVEQTTWHKEHYFGRTVEITEDKYVKSIYYWPQELDEQVVFYDDCQVVDLEREDAWITRNAESLRWLEGDFFDNGIIRMLKFYEDDRDYATYYCAVTNDNEHLIVSWLSGEYLLERFDTQDTDIALADIYGEWTITRLDSYDNAYEGREKDTEWVPDSYTEHLHFSDFYASEWFGKKVCITGEALDIDSEITGNITSITEQVVKKEAFEQEQGIHDELSLVNEEISVYEICYGENNGVIHVVPFNQNKMAIHIELGWFIMEKGVEEDPVAVLFNQPLFYDTSIQGEGDELKKQAGEFGERVRGEFEVVLEGKDIFPAELVAMIEEALYDSLDYETENSLTDMTRLEDIPYYKMLQALGADDYYMDLDDMYEHFPELQSANIEFKDEYDACGYVYGTDSCYAMFHIPMPGQEDRYIALWDGGGSNGSVEVWVHEMVDGELKVLYHTSVQNDGNGRMIQYDGEFYYILLYYNDGLKEYDGVQLFKLGEEDFEGNLMIKYVAKEFVWETVYNEASAYSGELDAYIESMKETITSEKYLEGGPNNEIEVLYGGEVATYAFPLAEEDKPYYGIDFANLGTPVYMRKSNHWPSNTWTTWTLKTKFYLWDENTDCVTELENLEVAGRYQDSIDIVQMWFQKIDDKIFTFRVTHINSYNYVLDVLLIEGDEITHMRRELLAPKREFVLYEGKLDFNAG